MRIRKNASRLLGSASAFSHPPPPLSPPLPSSPPGLAVCELNCSPWDLINTTPGPKEEEEEEGRGIAGICAELIEAEERITATATADAQTSAGSAAEMKIEEEEEEIKELILEKEEDQVIEKKAEEEATKCCNKRGKGWRCTRPAEPSHSFCSYHLTKLRSYLSSRRNNKTEAVRSTENRSQSKKRRPKKTTAAAESDSNSYYYYYGGFGPWRGKRRGGANVKVKDEEEILCKDLMHLDDSSDDGGSNVGDDGNVAYIDHQKVVEKREEGIVYCRKHDGKGWHCKRPAEPPHSFCSHHLAQFRSYHRSSHSKLGTPPLEEHSAIEPDGSKKKPPVKKKKKTAAAAAAESSESNFYYFYSGLGPWRGETRGGSRADKSHDSAVMAPEGPGDDEEGAEDCVRTRSLKSLL